MTERLIDDRILAPYPAVSKSFNKKMDTTKNPSDMSRPEVIYALAAHAHPHWYHELLAWKTENLRHLLQWYKGERTTEPKPLPTFLSVMISTVSRSVCDAKFTIEYSRTPFELAGKIRQHGIKFREDGSPRHFLR